MIKTRDGADYVQGLRRLFFCESSSRYCGPDSVGTLFDFFHFLREGFSILVCGCHLVAVLGEHLGHLAAHQSESDRGDLHAVVPMGSSVRLVELGVVGVGFFALWFLAIFSIFELGMISGTSVGFPLHLGQRRLRRRSLYG